MSNHVWVDPRIESVHVVGIRSYLLDRGWQLQAYPELLVFSGPVDDDGEPIVQVLPASEQLRDFRLRAEELIAALSVWEDRPAAEILTDMLREGTMQSPDGEKNGASAAPAPPRLQP